MFTQRRVKERRETPALMLRTFDVSSCEKGQDHPNMAAVFKTLQHSPIGLRLSRLDEELGADLREHGLAGVNVMTYTIEKKLTAESLSSVLMVIVRWRAKAKLGALRRRRIADIHPKTDGAVEMTLQKRRDSKVLFQKVASQSR